MYLGARCSGASVRWQALTVEDSSIVRKILRARLERAGWQVIEASNASEGWEQFQCFKPQLVMLDIVMPSGEGLDAFSLLKQIRQTAPGTAVLIVSGSSSIDDRDKFLEAGAMAFISKPFVDFEKILERFSRLYRTPVAERASDPSLTTKSSEVGSDVPLSTRCQPR